MSGTIAVLSKKGKDASEIALAMLRTLKLEKPQSCGIASSIIIRINRAFEALHDHGVNSPTVIGFGASRIREQDRVQPTRLTDATMIFHGKIYGLDEQYADASSAARMLQDHHEQNARIFVKRIEGDYIFIIAESDRIIAGRDVMGVCPLYYGDNMNFAALASERKALWKIGIERTDSFPPGHIGLVDKHGFRFASVRRLVFSKPKRVTMQTAAGKLQTLMERSTREKVHGLKEVALAFSGGLDSSIIALLAKKTGISVHLIHVSLENQSETECARQAAEELGLPIHCYTYAAKDMEKILPNILQLIEESEPVKVSIGIPIYWVAQKTAEMNFRVLLAGQGADEIFGGYQRYVDSYLQHGTENVEEMIFKDAVRMYQTNFERDFKICNFHNVELRLPFASYAVAKFAIDLPIGLKMEPSGNTLRKLVLRQAAKRLGLPKSIVNRPKKAIQYATGVNKAIQEIARGKGLTVREYLQEIFQIIFEETNIHE